MAIMAGRAYCSSSPPTGFVPNSSVLLLLLFLFIVCFIQIFQLTLSVELSCTTYCAVLYFL